MVGGRGGSSEEILHNEENIRSKMLNLFFILILILHGNAAVDDISAFYLPFFMSFKMFLARFAYHAAKINKY